jgi:hypothetical protein
MINENKVVFILTYLKGLAYDWFKSTLTNFLKNASNNWKKDIIMTFAS